MKKVLIVFLVLAVGALGAAFYFVATFDADKYRPLLEKKISEAIGHPVRIEKIKLGIGSGLACEIRGLAVYETPDGVPVLSLERAVATIRLLPLLQKSVEARSITLFKPRFEAVRAGGKVKLRGFDPPVSPLPDRAKDGAAAAASIFIGTVRIEQGEFTFIDASGTPVKRLPVRGIDVTLKNVSLTRPIDFEARMALLGDRQNLAASGRLVLPAARRPGVLENFKLDADLGGIDPALLTQAVPALSGADGMLTAQIDRLTLDDEGIRQAKAGLSINSGELSFTGFPKPLTGVALDAVAGEDKVEIRQLVGSIGGGTLRVQGAADNLKLRPRALFEMSADRMSLQDLVPAAPGNAVGIAGMLSAYFKGNANGATSAEMSQTLNGDGKIQVNEGVIVNFNVLREIFSQISAIPGAAESLQRNIPASYQEKINRPHTALAPFVIPISIRNGVVYLQPFQIAAEDFMLIGQGAVTPAGLIQARATLAVGPQLSDAMARSIPQLQYVLSPQGQLEIPVSIEGLWNHPKIRPDTQFLAQRFAAAKGQELISDLLTKKKEGQDASSEPSAQQKLLGSLFQ